VRLYSLALACHGGGGGGGGGDREAMTSLHNNRAMAHLKLGAHEAALSDTEAVLGDDAANIKALFRRGQALQGLGRWGEAVQVLREVVAQQPTNKAAHSELQACVERHSAPRLRARAPAVFAPRRRCQLGWLTRRTVTHRAEAQLRQAEKKPAIGAKKKPATSAKKPGGSAGITEVKTIGISEAQTSSNPAPASPTSPRKMMVRPRPAWPLDRCDEWEEVVCGGLQRPRRWQAPLKIGRPSVPTAPPTSATQFETHFQRLRKFPDLFSRYLQLMTPSLLTKIFKSSLTAEVLVAMVEALLGPDFLGKAGGGGAGLAFAYLQSLASLPRMGTTLCAMLASEKAALARLLGALETQAGQGGGGGGGGGDYTAAQVQSLRQTFTC
jgi:hypothetical protein